MAKNPLNSEIARITEICPHWIEIDVWTYIKAIIFQIREVAVDKIVAQSKIKTMCLDINTALDIISDITDAGQVWEAHKFIADLIDFYIVESVRLEYYEIATNLKLMQDFLCIKVF